MTFTPLSWLLNDSREYGRACADQERIQSDGHLHNNNSMNDFL